MTNTSNIDKYLAIVEWARERYSTDEGLVISIGGRASVYTRIEQAAAWRYLGCERR